MNKRITIVHTIGSVTVQRMQSNTIINATIQCKWANTINHKHLVVTKTLVVYILFIYKYYLLSLSLLGLPGAGALVAKPLLDLCGSEVTVGCHAADCAGIWVGVISMAHIPLLHDSGGVAADTAGTLDGHGRCSLALALALGRWCSTGRLSIGHAWHSIV